MKTAVFLTLVGAVAAYPSELLSLARRSHSSLERAQAVLQNQPSSDIFNASTQRVKTTGLHAFRAPNKNDLRGPCPGLNALANHGYIPHSGYTTVHELTEAAMDVFGIGSDLALFLATYGAVVDGDLSTLSIGGPPSIAQAAPAAGQVILGAGLSASHNRFESDASPTDPDRYLPVSKLAKTSTSEQHTERARLANFEQLFATQPNPDTANYNIATLSTFRAHRFHHSVANNPSFFLGPFTGMLMQPKSYTFIYRLMANHSEEHPEGIMNQETLKSFFAMTGPDNNGKFAHKPGHERIPDNWYRRDWSNPYDNSFFNTDVLEQAQMNPEFLNIGGNIGGRVNTFREVNLNKLTSGTYGTSSNGAYDFACLAYQSALHGARAILRERYADEFHATTTAIDTLRNAVVPILDRMECPRLRKIDDRLFQTYQGYTKAGSVY